MSNLKKKLTVSLTEKTPYTQLSLVEKNYVEARLQGLTVQASGKLAGLQDSSSPARLERSPKVRAAMRYLVKEGMQRSEDLSKNDVMRGMMDAVETAATSTELVGAWREIGKLIGAYEPERRILEIHDYSQEELKVLPEADLLKLAGKHFEDVIDGEFFEFNHDVSRDFNPDSNPDSNPDL